MNKETNFNEEIYLIHQIKGIISSEKKEEKMRVEYFRSGRTEKSGVNLLKDISKLIELTKFTEINFDFEKFQILRFIFTSRIRKEFDDIKYKFLYSIDPNQNYIILFIPETELLYSRCIIFKSLISELETDVIKYIDVIKENKLENYLQLDPHINVYYKINQKYDPTFSLLEKFEIDNNILFRIDLSYLMEIPITKLNILPGKEGNYLAIEGIYDNLNFLLMIKKLLKKFI